MNKLEIEKAVEGNIGLVGFVLRRYFPTQQYDEDLYQIGMIGLWKAAKRYKKKENATFATYARNVIKNEIIKELEKQSAYKRRLNQLNNTISLDEENDSEHWCTPIVEDRSEECCICFCEMLNSLTEEKKEIITYSANGLTVKEISKKTPLSSYKVKKIVKSFIEELKEQMKER